MYKLGKFFGTFTMMLFAGILLGFDLTAISLWVFRNSFDCKRTAVIGGICGSIIHFALFLIITANYYEWVFFGR